MLLKTKFLEDDSNKYSQNSLSALQMAAEQI